MAVGNSTSGSPSLAQTIIAKTFSKLAAGFGKAAGGKASKASKDTPAVAAHKKGESGFDGPCGKAGGAKAAAAKGKDVTAKDAKAGPEKAAAHGPAHEQKADKAKEKK